MKVLKKIGIVSLSLVLCLFSCFRFVNAQTGNTFTYNSTSTYYFMINDEEEFEAQAPLRLAYGLETEMFFDVSYPVDSPTINVGDPSGENPTNIASTYIGDYNGKKCYSFVPGVYSVANGTTMEIIDNYAVAFSLTPFGENDESEFSVYDTIYSLIQTYIFGGNIVVGSHQDLTATILSSIICVLVFALPFLVIWKVIKVIMG